MPVVACAHAFPAAVYRERRPLQPVQQQVTFLPARVAMFKTANEGTRSSTSSRVARW